MDTDKLLEIEKLLLSSSNLLTFIGFCITAFAFLSQYLNFPKDLLSELARAKRNSTHELPPSCEKENDLTKKGSRNVIKDSQRIKVFFLESDTVTFATLFFLLFSISVSVTILVQLIGYINCSEYLIPILSGIYFLLLLLLVFSAYIKPRRDWPNLYRRSKRFYIFSLIIVNLVISSSICWNACYSKSAVVFILLLVGILFHFVMILLPMSIRGPVTSLVSLWEELESNNNQESSITSSSKKKKRKKK